MMDTMFYDITVTGKYLWIPVCNRPAEVQAVFSAAGNMPEVPLNFAPGTRENYDFIASYPLHFFGETLRVRGENLTWLDRVTQADEPWRAPAACPERPAYHYSANCGWLNDPNGLYWYEGLWHMFHQYNPLANFWGNMHWLHAVSRDLIHWEEMGIAIAPLPAGDAFSGGAVLDFANTSGLQEKPGVPPVLLFYTAHLEGAHTQRMIYSTDGGSTFREYPGNPVLGTIGDGGDRDPSIARDPENGDWLMALYLGDSQREFALLRSDDLCHWHEIQRFHMPQHGRECPELLRMVDEKDGKNRWVLLDACGNYLVWERKNDAMQPVRDGKFIFRGEDGGAYACQIFKNAPDGIVTGIAWQQSRIRHAAFSQSMTLPFQMRLKDGKVLVSPHPAVKTLRSRTWSYAPLTTADSMPAGNGLWELKMTLLRENKTEMQLCGLNFSFDGVANTINVDGKSFPAPECAEFRIFIDRTSIEVYAADGSFWCARDAEPDAAQPPVVLPPGTEIPHLILHALEKT
jgi:sucrose-6-phosphate hydrolase SacC (GH32 family)